jgi:murein DD-endopeptidase MepM/ murein hydrolase activator NlpD
LVADAPRGLPVSGRLTQAFHPGHHGIDIGVPVGTPIRSTMAGRVVQAGWNNQGYGNLVIVEAGPYRTYYAHLDSIPVAPGQTVAAGDVIGLSGNTGNSTGPHLHYEVRVNGTPVPPDPAA